MTWAYNLRWSQAAALCRAGQAVRRYDWTDRWIVWAGHLFWLVYPSGESRVIKSTDFTRAEFLAMDWTTQPSARECAMPLPPEAPPPPEEEPIAEPEAGAPITGVVVFSHPEGAWRETIVYGSAPVIYYGTGPGPGPGHAISSTTKLVQMDIPTALARTSLRPGTASPQGFYPAPLTLNFNQAIRLVSNSREQGHFWVPRYFPGPAIVHLSGNYRGALRVNGAYVDKRDTDPRADPNAESDMRANVLRYINKSIEVSAVGSVRFDITPSASFLPRAYGDPLPQELAFKKAYSYNLLVKVQAL